MMSPAVQVGILFPTKERQSKVEFFEIPLARYLPPREVIIFHCNLREMRVRQGERVRSRERDTTQRDRELTRGRKGFDWSLKTPPISKGIGQRFDCFVN
jgi:hypothetical protein